MKGEKLIREAKCRLIDELRAPFINTAKGALSGIEGDLGLLSGVESVDKDTAAP